MQTSFLFVFSCSFFFFFFSSRRRHTRYWRDWSSDVCSSDLRASTPCSWRRVPATARPVARRRRSVEGPSRLPLPGSSLGVAFLLHAAPVEIGRASCRERV